MFNPDPFHAGSHPMRPARPAPAPLLHEITLGVHRLVLNSDQSIELVRAEQGQAEPAYVLCLDALEAYRLMLSLNELFQRTFYDANHETEVSHDSHRVPGSSETNVRDHREGCAQTGCNWPVR